MTVWKSGGERTSRCGEGDDGTINSEREVILWGEGTVHYPLVVVKTNLYVC